MFFGPMAEHSDPIAVPDVTPAAFKAMLTFVYTDKVDLTELECAWELWYAAKKYLLDGLEEKCRYR